MTLLTDKQREEVVEAMCKTKLPGLFKYGVKGLPGDGPSTRKQMANLYAEMDTALTAALPAIERAVLERAGDVARAARDRAEASEGFGAAMVTDAAVSVADQIVADIRALAGEVG